MRPDGIVFLVSESDDAFGMFEEVKLVLPGALVTNLPVERLDDPVSLGLAWRDEHPVCFTSPIGQSFTD